MNRRMLFDSMITLSAPAIFLRMSGMAAASIPCRVLTQMECLAPATRKREVSLSPLRSCSSVMARVWSSVAQWQGLPSAEQMPCPYCVIFRAVQLNSGNAAINPATTLVLPTLRECPPITTKDMLIVYAFDWKIAKIAVIAKIAKIESQDRVAVPHYR